MEILGTRNEVERLHPGAATELGAGGAPPRCDNFLLSRQDGVRS